VIKIEKEIEKIKDILDDANCDPNEKLLAVKRLEEIQEQLRLMVDGVGE